MRQPGGIFLRKPEGFRLVRRKTAQQKKGRRLSSTSGQGIAFPADRRKNSAFNPTF